MKLKSNKKRVQNAMTPRGQEGIAEHTYKSKLLGQRVLRVLITFPYGDVGLLDLGKPEVGREKVHDRTNLVSRTCCTRLQLVFLRQVIITLAVT